MVWALEDTNLLLIFIVWLLSTISQEYVTSRVLGHTIILDLNIYRSGLCSMSVEMANIATKSSSRDNGLLDRLSISTRTPQMESEGATKYDDADIPRQVWYERVFIHLSYV